LRRLVPPLVFAVLVLALCWRAWLPVAGGPRSFSYDAREQYWGEIAVQVHAARRGELPLWNPYDRCGYPFAADPQPGNLYPLTWLLVGAGLLFGAGWWLVSIKVMFHLWWWGLGMYVWLRRRGLPPPACTAAGMFCLLAYPTSHGLFSALNWGMAWTPWVLVAVEAWAAAPTVKRAATLALALGMAWLVGAPASFWYTGLVAGPVAAWALASHGTLRAAARTAPVAAALFLGMAAGQALATAGAVEHTVRAERDLAFIAQSFLRSDSLLGLVVPRLQGLQSYLGLMNLFAAGCALALRPGPRTFVLAGIAGGGLLLSLGSDAGWLPNLASALPPAGYFRRAHRYLFVVMIPLAALAAEGLWALAQVEGDEARRRWRRLVLLLAAGGAVVLGAGAALGPRVPYLTGLASLALSAAALWLVVARPRWLVLAAAVSILDVWYARLPQIEANFPPAPATPRDAEGRALPLETRVFDQGYLGFRPGSRLGIRDFGGYQGDPLALRRYARLLALAEKSPEVLGHANVGVLLAKAPRPLPAVAPAVAWYPAATLVESEELALRAVTRAPPGTRAVLEAPALTPDELAAVRALPSGGEPAAGRLVELGLNHVVAEIDAPAAGVVVVAEAYHPGWRATVDGAPARVLPANGLLRAVLVGPGRHRVELRFSAGAVPALLGLGLLAMALAAVLAARRGA
jgi:hypothetical protein